MNILREIIEPSLEVALTDIGVKDDFWKRALGTSRERDQGDLSLPCFPFAKQLGRNPAEIAEDLARNVWPLIESGEIKPVIDSTYKLEEVIEAHERLESSNHIGKITLKVL